MEKGMFIRILQLIEQLTFINQFKRADYLYRRNLYNKLNYKLRTGKLLRGLCCITGKPEGEQHHISYRPEVYIWLSKDLHDKLHAKLKRMKKLNIPVNQEVQLKILNDWKEDIEYVGNN